MTFFDLKLFRGQALGFVKSGTKILIGILLLVADLLLLYVVKPRPAMVFNDATTWWHITAVLGALAWAFTGAGSFSVKALIIPHPPENLSILIADCSRLW